MFKLSKDELAKDIIRVIESHNGDTTLETYKKYGKYSVCSCYNKFGGGWRKTLTELGYAAKQSKTYSREDVVKDVLSIFNTTNNRGQDNYIRNGKYSRSVIKRLFGSWNKMLRELGFSVNMTKPGQYTEQDIIDDYNRVKSVLGKEPSCAEYRKYGTYSQPVIDRMFGSYTAFSKIVGRRRDARFISDDEILEDLRRIAKQFKVLSSEIITSECIASYPTVLERFGTMKELGEVYGLPTKPSIRESKFFTQCMNIVKRYWKDEYVTEKTFEWLKNPKTNRPLFIDAYFPKRKVAVEIDGSQHYAPRKFYGENRLKTIQERDRIKNELVTSHGIKMVRIKKGTIKEIEEKLNA